MVVRQERFAAHSERPLEPSDLEIRDCTLREAEQAVGLAVNEKLRLARALDKAGIRRIQVGAPGRSETDREACRRLKSEGIPLRLDGLAVAYVSGWKDHIDACADCGVDAIDLVHPVSVIYLERVLRISHQQMLDQIGVAVEYACRAGVARVAVSAMDAPRAALETLAQVAQTARQAGAGELFICDSVGVAGPRWIGSMVEHLAGAQGIQIGIHCHNDLGLALANTLAAVEAGASVLDVTVNGLGERAGNVSLDELVVVLRTLYHLDVGVDPARLTELAALMADLSQVPLPFNKPLVGAAAFAHRHDTHARAAVTEPAAIEPVEPASVGNKRQFACGKYSGPFVIRQIGKRLGVNLIEGQAEEAAQRVRRVVTEDKQPLSDESFLRLIADLVEDGGKHKRT